MENKKYYPWLVVGLLWGVALLNYMDRQMLSTMRPSMQMDIKELKSAVQFGYLMSVFLWIYGFASPVAGIIADKYNRKWLIVGSLFVWSAVTFCMSFATNFKELYWLRALMGLSEAIYIPSALSLIADFHKKETRSLAIAIHMTGLYIGQALGGFGATVAEIFTWKTAFHTFGLIGIVYSVVLVFFLKDKRIFMVDRIATIPQKHRFSKILLSLFKNVYFWVILIYFAVPSLPGWATKNWLPTLFSQKLDIPMSAAGPASTISIALSSLLGVLFGGMLSDRWVQKNVKGRIYTGAIGLSLMIPALFFLGTGFTLLHVLAAALCFGFGYGMFDANNMPILCQFVSSQKRATAYGIMNMTGIFSGAIITNMLGRSSDAGSLSADFAVLAGILLLVLFLQLYFLNPKTNEYVD